MRYIFGIHYNEGHSQQMSFTNNLWPGWKKFEQERVLVGMNTMHKNEAITIKDGDISIEEGADCRDNLFQLAIMA